MVVLGLENSYTLERRLWRSEYLLKHEVALVCKGTHLVAQKKVSEAEVLYTMLLSEAETI